MARSVAALPSVIPAAPSSDPFPISPEHSPYVVFFFLPIPGPLFHQ